jgi:hypothetical protein
MVYQAGINNTGWAPGNFGKIRGSRSWKCAQNGSLIEIAHRLAEKPFDPPLIQNQFRSALRRSDDWAVT